MIIVLKENDLKSVSNNSNVRNVSEFRNKEQIQILYKLNRCNIQMFHLHSGRLI